MKEAEKFLPLTSEILNGGFENLFREFSRGYKSPTTKKHLADALGFCRFLQQSDAVSAYGKEAAKYEAAKLRFYNYGARFVICRLKFDLKEIFRGDGEPQSSDSSNKTKYVFWFRIGNKNKHFVI